jgi:hypothetical protein
MRSLSGAVAVGGEAVDHEHGVVARRVPLAPALVGDLHALQPAAEGGGEALGQVEVDDLAEGRGG